jgi:hypothetical protein
MNIIALPTKISPLRDSNPGFESQEDLMTTAPRRPQGTIPIFKQKPLQDEIDRSVYTSQNCTSTKGCRLVRYSYIIT